MKRLGLQTRRKLRLVLFENEENGLRGASAYAERYRAAAMDHVFALESDSGVLAPAALGFTGSAAARAAIQQIGTLLASIGMSDIAAGGGGADIGPIAQAASVPTMAYLGDATRFFAFHHTAADTIERISPGEVRTAVASIAVMAYGVAEWPDRLPR
jgi:carboxypeptidase Q